MVEVTSNVEFAPKIHEHGHGKAGHSSGAGAAFDAGVENRETGDSYVRVTLLLATVLLLTAVAFVLLAISTHSLLVFPRA